MSSPLAPLGAPYGPSAPATDCLVLSAPASDTALDPPARSFKVLTNGTVSVTTLQGNDRTWAETAGTIVPLSITTVLAATTVDLLLFRD